MWSITPCYTLALHGLEEPFFQLCCCVVSVLVLVGNRFWFTYYLVVAVVNTWAFWSGERDLQCFCCAAVLFFTNRSLSSEERDCHFSLCASASVSKIWPFSQEEGTCVVSCAHQHFCITFELCPQVREIVDVFVVQHNFWPRLELSHWERGTLNIVWLLQNLLSNFVWRNIQHAF